MQQCNLTITQREKRYGDSADADSTAELQRLLPYPNVPVAVSKCIWAIKLHTNKILQFLTGSAG